MSPLESDVTESTSVEAFTEVAREALGTGVLDVPMIWALILTAGPDDHERRTSTAPSCNTLMPVTLAYPPFVLIVEFIIFILEASLGP